MSAPTSDPGYHPDLKEVSQHHRFSASRAVMALILREMATTYGRSPLGYLWAIMVPATTIAILSVFFSLMMRSPPLGTNFAIFFATGMVPFRMWRDLQGKIESAITFSRGILTYPRVTFLDAILARFLLNSLTNLLVFYIVITGIMIFYDTRVAPDLPTIALAFAMLIVLALAFGLLNCLLKWAFPPWQKIWGMLTRPLVFVSGVLFLFDDIPQPYQDWLWWNPLVHVVGQMRSGFFPYYEAEYVNFTYVFVLSLGLVLISLILLRRFALEIMNF